jgi:hypothetical protein
MFRLLLPLACAWAGKQERRILREGVPLIRAEREEAASIGVRYPERVRVLAVATIPLPMHRLLREAARSIGLISPQTVGMTLRYGIYVRLDCQSQRRLLVHELAHVAQYERLGGLREFLELYLMECLDPGYPLGPLEQEAIRIEREICATVRPGPSRQV